MTAPVYNIVIDQGSTFEMDLSIDLNGVDLNLNGYYLYGTYRQSFDSEAFSEFDMTITDYSTGTVRMGMSAEQTDMLTKDGLYDIELHRADGTQVIRILQGSVSVKRSVTTQH